MRHRVEQRRFQTFALFECLSLTRLLKAILQLAVKPLDFLPGNVGLFRSLLRSSGQLTHRDRSNQKCEESDPVFRIVNNEGVERREKEKVERGDAQERRQNRGFGTPGSGDE